MLDEEKPTSVVIMMPTYNDWSSVELLLPKLDAALLDRNVRITVLIIDDGSTLSLESGFCKNVTFSVIHEVRVITLARNMGNQSAIALGIGYVAAKLRCDYLVIMDSDHEDKPEYVPDLLEKAKGTHNKIVFAERTERSEGLIFRGFYALYKSLYNILTGMPLSVGNFSAVPFNLVKRLAYVTEIQSHFPAGVMKEKIPFTAIPTVRGKRVHGKSKMSLVKLIIHGISGLAVHADVVGVRVVLGILGLAALVSFGIMFVILLRIFSDMPILGWSSQIVLTMGSIFFQALISGLLVIFIVLSNRNQRTILPSHDYKIFILKDEKIYPVL
jgi:hypothetical protein